MSEYWRLYCVDCNDDLDALDLNHGAEELARLWEARAGIVAAAKFEKDNLPACLEIKIERLGEKFPAWFFVLHENHNVRVKSEYGSLWGECAKFIRCKCCGSTVSCNHPTGHDGECGREAVKP